MRFQKNYPELSKEICGDGPISLKRSNCVSMAKHNPNLRWQVKQNSTESCFLWIVTIEKTALLPHQAEP